MPRRVHIRQLELPLLRGADWRPDGPQVDKAAICFHDSEPRKVRAVIALAAICEGYAVGMGASGCTAIQALQAASAITHKGYFRGEHLKALADLNDWLKEHGNGAF